MPDGQGWVGQGAGSPRLFSGPVGLGRCGDRAGNKEPPPPELSPSPPQILIQSVCETMVPKLVAEDIPLLFSLLSDVFPGVQYHRGEMTALREELRKVCQEMYLTYGDGEEVGGMWVEKVSGASWLEPHRPRGRRGGSLTEPPGGGGAGAS